nr:hypothetical protein [Paraburkholderia mimosarum]
MELSVERVDVWAAAIDDKPGGLAKLLGVLRNADVDLQFIVAGRTAEASGKGGVKARVKLNPTCSQRAFACTARKAYAAYVVA